MKTIHIITVQEAARTLNLDSRGLRALQESISRGMFPGTLYLFSVDGKRPRRLVEEADVQVWRELYEPRHDDEIAPHIIGYDEATADADMLCPGCDTQIAAGEAAYRQTWSDGRVGAIVCRVCGED